MMQYFFQVTVLKTVTPFTQKLVIRPGPIDIQALIAWLISDGFSLFSLFSDDIFFLQKETLYLFPKICFFLLFNNYLNTRCNVTLILPKKRSFNHITRYP